MRRTVATTGGRIPATRSKSSNKAMQSVLVINIILIILIIIVAGSLIYYLFSTSSTPQPTTDSIIQKIPDKDDKNNDKEDNIDNIDNIAMASCAMNNNCTRAVCVEKHPDLSTTCALADCRTTYFNNPGSCFDNGIVNASDCKKRFGNDLFTLNDCRTAYFKNASDVFNASLVSAGDCRKRFGRDLFTLDDCKNAFFNSPATCFDNGVITDADCIRRVGLDGFLKAFGDGFVYDVVLSDQKFTIRSDAIVLAHLITFLSVPPRKGGEGCYVRDGTKRDEDVTDKIRTLQAQQQYSNTLTDDFVQNIRREPNAARTTYMTKVLLIVYSTKK